jgi:hypothetical protein
MNRTVRIAIFIGILIAVFLVLLALQIQSNISGQIYPKWHAFVIVIIAYFVLFPKSKKSE